MMVQKALVQVSDTNEVETAIVELVDMIRAYRERGEAIEEKIEEAKAELRELLDKYGQSWADDEGYARLVSEGIRTSYDTKELDELIIKDPLRYGWLKDYRKQSPVRGGVQVK